MGPIQAPDFCSEATRKKAAAINARITANNAALADARREREEVLKTVKDMAAARVADLDSLMTCDPDPAPDDNGEVTRAERNLRKANVLFLRQEIEILHDVPTIEAAIAADRADALLAVEKDLASTVARVKAGLEKLGFGRFIASKPHIPCPRLGTFGPPARDYVIEFVYSNDEVAKLEAERQAILAHVPAVPNGDRFIFSGGPRFDLDARRQAVLSNRLTQANGNAAIAQAEAKLREALGVAVNAPTVAEERRHNYPAQDTRRLTTPRRQSHLIGEEFSGWITD